MVITRKIILFAVCLLLLLAGGCENRTHVDKNDTMNWAKSLDLPCFDSTAAKHLEVIVWHDLIPSEVTDLFRETYGTEVVLTLIKSDEEMFELLRNNPGKYDAAFPSDFMVLRMKKYGLLKRLDHDHIENIKYLNEEVLRNDYDRGIGFSVPLFRTCVGISLNIDYVSGIPRDWHFLISQISNEYFAFRGGIRKDMRIALGLALILGGYSPNSVNPEEIANARDALINAVVNYGVNLVGPESAQMLVDNELLLGFNWNGNVAYALDHNSSIRFLLPEDKVIAGYWNFIISASSEKARTAELFIDYLLVPEVSAHMTNVNYFANCNDESLPFVKKIIRNGPGFIFPSEENRVFLKDLGEQEILLYEEAWAQVLNAKPAQDLIKLPLPQSGIFMGKRKKP